VEQVAAILSRRPIHQDLQYYSSIQLQHPNFDHSAQYFFPQTTNQYSQPTNGNPQDYHATSQITQAWVQQPVYQEDTGLYDSSMEDHQQYLDEEFEAQMNSTT